jgi:uncharacterized lipoprotein YajG
MQRDTVKVTSMTKKLAAIIVLVVVASLSFAGCTTTTNNTATSPSPQAHDATLEKYVNVVKCNF